ncbi:MAG TPA: prepilin-type N-terminal cleavage/methylation domain-containing protein [Candidatus Paceibacterota bacterium]|nr:prepilin-type N-terminal cleavage/methylation domain-containing protein [Candidatus Paceibacterota bacterium]
MRNRQSGFTAVEVVIALVGVVIALLIAAWALGPVVANFSARVPPVIAAPPPAAPWPAVPSQTRYVPCYADRNCTQAIADFVARAESAGFSVEPVGPYTFNGQTCGYYFLLRPQAP